MSDVPGHLTRWREAGLIDSALEERLLAFEGGIAVRPARAGDRPGLLEAMLYLGLVVAGVGAFALTATNWGELERWARLASVAVPALLALAVGFGTFRAEDAGLQRGGQLAWLAAVALTAGLAAVVSEEYGGGAGNRGLLLLNGSVTAAIALALWVISPRSLQVLALGGAFVFLSQTLGAWPDDHSFPLAGMTLLGLGVGGVVLAETGAFSPRPAARIVFGTLAVAGPYLAGINESVPWAELLVFVVAAGLAALGVWRASFALVVVAVVATFVALITFVFEHFSDDLGAPVALMLSGGLVVAGVLILSQVRGAIRQRRTRA